MGRAIYAPFGAPEAGGATLGGFGFTGEQTDAETGLVYLRARSYDPASGRFVQADSWLGTVGSPRSHNLFAYGNNNPMLYTDPSGHFAIIIPAAVAWAVPYIGAAAVISCLAHPACRDLMADLTVAAWRGTEAFQQQATNQISQWWQQLCSGYNASQPGGAYSSQSSTSSGDGRREGAPEQPSTPNGISNSEFGELMNWGRGDADARAQIPNLDPDKLRRGGLTAEKAEEWAEFYRKVAARNPNNPSAAGRAELMEAAARALRGGK